MVIMMTSKEMVSLDYFMVQIQKKCDAVAGLKVQNTLLKKENNRLDIENQNLARELTTLNHNYKILEKEYEGILKKWECKDDSYKNGDNNGGV